MEMNLAETCSQVKSGKGGQPFVSLPGHWL